MILITGATGTIGSEVARTLSAQNVPIRALVRNPAKATALQRLPHIDITQGDLTDPASLARAFQGITRTFLSTTPAPDQADLHSRFVDAAKGAGVKHIVRLSAARGDGTNRIAQLNEKADRHLQNSGVSWTILQPTFFMQNLLNLAGMIKAGTLYQPAGSGRAGHIDARDIAAVAAACLTQPGHENQTYSLTGPEDLTYTEIASRFSEVLGRTVVYVDIPPEAARHALLQLGTPAWNTEAILELMAALRADHFSLVTDTVRQVTHHRPRTIDQFIRDHETVFGAEVH